MSGDYEDDVGGLTRRRLGRERAIFTSEGAARVVVASLGDSVRKGGAADGE